VARYTDAEDERWLRRPTGGLPLESAGIFDDGVDGQTPGTGVARIIGMTL
jgi:hypothetical protein